MEKKITEFSTTKYGLSKFLYKPRDGMNYYAEIFFKNGTKEKYKLPKFLLEGVTVGLEQKNSKEIILFLTTNKKSLNKLANKEFELLIHRDGLLKKIDIKFNNVDTTYAIVIKKDFLLDGMNIITLIDDKNNPILERLYFNYINHTSPKVNIEFKKNELDSLVFEIDLKKKFNGSMNLSFSVLPSETYAYMQNQNILSTFNLKPYVKGNIENPAFYFTDFDESKAKELDLLLLTQGWSRYEWKNLNSPPIEKYEFEQGLDVKGRINMKVDIDDKVILFPTKYHASTISSIMQNNFEISNLILTKGESLNISLLNKNNKLLKPKLYVNTQAEFAEDILETNYSTITTIKIKEDLVSYNVDDFIDEGAVELGEVLLIGNRKKKAESNIYIASYLKNKVTEITEEIAFNFQFITDIIKSRGYDVRVGLGAKQFDRVSIRVKTVQSLIGNAALTFPEPIIYLDDQRLSDFDVLYNAPTSDFESYYFQKSGASEGTRGAGGVIRLYSKRDNYKSKNSRPEQSSEYIVENGFEPSKKFYTPKYRVFENPAFKKYGIIHWDSDVTLEANKKINFRIFNTGIKNLIFYYEGMGGEW
ncbi:hypothetical protein [Gillisia marina]|uniref:hypothetical protein n=1 Tax=Gillisia marina TaxID=1167637 RepID=UPI00031BC0E6|nr:hypothetical protein [Gillisia marina]